MDLPLPIPVCEPWRFWQYVDASGDCWNWTGWTAGGGYGRFAVTRKVRPVAHRFAYENLVGPVPEGLELDHLCRNRLCVNPDHLEPVTSAENRRRAIRLLPRKTHCINGHEYTTENTGYIHYRSNPRRSTPSRYCLRCHATKERARLARRNVA